jgi:MSHA pilin protein MshD
MRTVPRYSGHRGFTLIEALIASFVVAVATVGVGSMLAATSQQSGAMNDSSIGQALARQLMEEIASKPIEDSTGAISLGPESGETSRSQYDQIDDYNGYSDTTSSIQMLDGTTVNLGNGQTYTRSVAVEYRTTASGAASNASTAPFCVVSVTVTAANGVPVKLTRLFARTATE